MNTRNEVASFLESNNDYKLIVINILDLLSKELSLDIDDYDSFVEAIEKVISELASPYCFKLRGSIYVLTAREDESSLIINTLGARFDELDIERKIVECSFSHSFKYTINEAIKLLDDSNTYKTKYSVLIVEDQEMVRKFFERIVSESDSFELKFSIRNADLSDLYVRKNKIDLILMDVYTDRGASGLEAAYRIKQFDPSIKIIITTSLPEFSYLKRAREIGVDSFMYKELSKEPLINIMERTMRGESIYPDSTPVVTLGEVTSEAFSERELEVLRELTSGDTNEIIAERLCISVPTVKTHIAKLLSKTGYKTRTELAIKARESGLVIKN